MLSSETLQDYRRMSPGERLAMTLQMTAANTRYLFAGDDAAIDRRFELLRLQNHERNRRICEALVRAEHYDERR